MAHSHLRQVANAKHETDSIQDVALSAAIEAGDGVEQRVEARHDCAVRVRFEAVDDHLLWPDWRAGESREQITQVNV